MSAFRRFINLWRDSSLAQEFDDELAFHLEMRVEANRRLGMTEAEARAEARRHLGALSRAKEGMREAHILRGLDLLSRSVSHAARRMARAPALPAIVVLTLALGIGANAAMFSMVWTLLVAPPPYGSPDRLVMLSETRAGAPLQAGPVSGPNFHDWKAQSTLFDEMAAITGGDAVMSGPAGAPVHVRGRFVSDSYFAVFGLKAAFGRVFIKGDETPERRRVVVLSHRFWMNQLGADPSVIGRTLRLDDESYEVIGVMPRGSAVDLIDPEIWRPRDLANGGIMTPAGQTARNRRDLNYVAARLKAGVPLARARAEMNGLSARMAVAYPESNSGHGILLQPWARPVDNAARRALLVLLTGVVIALAACLVNLASLSWARAESCTHDIAIQTALGATRRQLVLRHVMPTLLTVVAGTALAVVVARTIVNAVAASAAAGRLGGRLPRELEIAFDGSSVLALAGLAVVSAAVLSLTVVLTVWRTPSQAAVRAALNVGVRSTRHSRLGQSLVAMEVALAFVLVASAGAVLASFTRLQRDTAAGFDAANVLTAEMPLPRGRLHTPEQTNEYFDRIGRSLTALPGVSVVAFAEGLPNDPTPFAQSLQVLGRPPAPIADRPLFGFNTVSASYFQAAALRVIAGRSLADSDRPGMPLVLVVNATLARTSFPAGDAVGQRLSLRMQDTDGDLTETVWQVVGVVEDEGLFWDRQPAAMAYVTRAQHPSRDLRLVVKTSLDPATLIEPIRRAVATVDPGQAVADVRTLEQRTRDSLAVERLMSMLSTGFGVVALAIGVMGLYGVTASEAARRARELSIRNALGTSQGKMVVLLLRRILAVILVGLLVGLLLERIGRMMLAAVVAGIEWPSGTLLAATAALLTASGMMACAIPAIRASRCHPADALRAEW